MLLSPQSVRVYKALSSAQGLTVRQIAAKLGVLPNAVYRSVRPLQAYGLVRTERGYPERFVAMRGVGRVDEVTHHLRTELVRMLGIADVEPPVTTVDNRDEFLRTSNRAVQKAMRSVDFIVSGLEVPADTILEYKQAVDRGVRIRALVYQRDETSVEMYQNWRAIGVEVRVCERYMPARIFVIDRRVCIYASYDPNKGWEARGQQAASRTLGVLLGQVFDERWRDGYPVTAV